MESHFEVKITKLRSFAIAIRSPVGETDISQDCNQLSEPDINNDNVLCLTVLL